MAGGIVITTATVAAARHLARRGWDAPARHTAATAGAALATVALFAVLPEPIKAADVPAALLYEFRLRSLAVQATLYLTLAAVFGHLAERRPGAARSAVGPTWRDGRVSS